MEEEDDEKQYFAITHFEEAELRRVYDLMCSFAITNYLKADIAVREEALSKLDPKQHEDHSTIEKLNSEVASLQSELKTLQDDPQRKVREDDLEAALIFLGRKNINKQEIKDMIWEVDENLDGCVDWDEFQLMFIRNINDTTGLEPSKFYNVVQFMIYDKKVTGMVSVDDTMKMLFERYGRAKMEMKLKELFGTDMKEAGKGGGEINFANYCNAVDRLQLQAFNNSTVGKLLQQTKNKGLS